MQPYTDALTHTQTTLHPTLCSLFASSEAGAGSEEEREKAAPRTGAFDRPVTV